LQPRGSAAEAARSAFDLLVLMTCGLIAAPLVIGNAATGRLQGVVTLIAFLSILSFAVIEIMVVIMIFKIAFAFTLIVRPSQVPGELRPRDPGGDLDRVRRAGIW
jgi:hypothetical protein